MLFKRLFLCALLVGLFAGLTYSAIQRWQVVPTIVAAEVFESALAPEAAADHHPPGTAAHVHNEAAWEPKEGAERLFWTVVANVLGATGFALLLIPALAWWDRQRGGNGALLRSGLVWGAAGWLCVFVWPALGLGPELPGQAAAGLHLRQAWWLLAVVCAAGGLALLSLVPGKIRWLGLPLLALPFIVGAPDFGGPAFASYPAEAAAQMELLRSRFIVATFIASAVQWLVLGALCGIVVERWLRPLLALPPAADALPAVMRPAA
ncbi:MAG: CbtA family protein [Rubrivivax sp.]|nr:CbtA family protein [Rubrivivax sp.]